MQAACTKVSTVSDFLDSAAERVSSLEGELKRETGERRREADATKKDLDAVLKKLPQKTDECDRCTVRLRGIAPGCEERFLNAIEYLENAGMTRWKEPAHRSTDLREIFSTAQPFCCQWRRSSRDNQS